MLKLAFNIALLFLLANSSFALKPFKIQGTWVNLDERPAYGLAIVLKKNNIYEEYLFHDKSERFKNVPSSCVWGGYGTYSLKGNILLLNMKHNASNTPRIIKRYKIIKLTQKRLVLIDLKTNKKIIFVRFN